MDLGIGGLGVATEIGVGASAIVYRARQLDLDREVAVKVLSVTDDAFVRRFRREAKTLGKLSQNPGIVTVYDTGVTGAGQPYLILELCKSSVLDHLNTHGVFDPMLACQAAAQVAAAIANAHENGVVHRDLKPGNVLLSQTGRYMVTDFGISTVTGATMGQTNSVGFTAGYVAPETLTGETVGPPSDVYALGATLFHMVGGRAPFVADEQGSNLLALAQRVVNDPVPNLRDEGIPHDVCELIEAAMAKKPADRPTALELQARLTDVAGEMPAAPAVTTTDDHFAAGASAGTSGLFGESPAGQETIAGLDSPPLGEQPPASSNDFSLFDDDLFPSSDATQVTAGDPTAAMGAPVIFGPGGQDLGLGQGVGIAEEPVSGGYNPPPSTNLSPGEGHILSAETNAVPQIAPTADERRYQYTTDDRRQIGPLLVGAIVGLIALVGVGAFLISQSGGEEESDSDEAALTETVDGPATSVSPNGNEAVGEDGAVGRSSLPTTSVAEETTTSSSSSSTTSTTEAPPVVVAVPNVAGLAQTEAISALTAAGLVANPVDEESSTVDVGDVIRQDPLASATAFEGDVVSIYVSTEGEIQTVDVPQLVGLTRVAALVALTESELTSAITTENSASVAEGNVISSSPELGTTVNVGSEITLVISDGPAVPECSDVEGTTLASATAAFEAAGLSVTSMSESSSTVADGLVISCTATTTSASLVISSGPANPCPGLIGRGLASVTNSLETAGFDVTANPNTESTSPVGEVLTCRITGSDAAIITYAAAAADPTCPSVASLTFAQASAAATAAGFTDVVRDNQPHPTIPLGQAISCTSVGSTATIEVSAGPALVAVPDVSGSTVAAAGVALRAAGFTVGTTEEMESTLPEGQVIGTSPAVGTEVADGSAVGLIVSSGPAVELVVVPNLVGRTELAASNLLEGRDLVPSVVSSSVPAGDASIGTVILASVAAGTEVPPGTVVVLTVAEAEADEEEDDDVLVPVLP